jgi:hypothetical protein
MIIMLTYLKISQNHPPVMLKIISHLLWGLKREDSRSSIVTFSGEVTE